MISQIARRSMRLFAIPLLIIGLAVLLTELDVILWTQLWFVPPIIALYVGVEILIASLPKKKPKQKRRTSRANNEETKP